MVKKNIFADKENRRDNASRRSPAQAQIRALKRAMEFGEEVPKEDERLALGVIYRIDKLLKEYEERMDVAAIDMSVQKKIQSDFSDIPIYRAQILDTDVHTDTMGRYKRYLLGHIDEMEHVYTNQVMRMVKKSLLARIGG